MARTHGKNVDFAYAGVAIEDELNSATITFDVPEAEITAFSDAYQNFLAGKPTATLSVDGSWDPQVLRAMSPSSETSVALHRHGISSLTEPLATTGTQTSRVTQ